jgi:hypothetical protein
MMSVLSQKIYVLIVLVCRNGSNERDRANLSMKTDSKETRIHKPLSPFFTKETQINKPPSHLFTAVALPLHSSEESY